VNQELHDQLTKPFPQEAVGKKPVITCKACSDSKDKVCGTHRKVNCKACGNYITNKHQHLDFVGHAFVTERLLDVDKDWSWRPIAIGANGLPLLDENGGLWIELTIGGKSRLGYGDADGKRGGKAIKEAIGDAIRNAAMRFGVALEMWKKESPKETADDIPDRQVDRPQQTPEERKTELRGQIAAVGKEKGMSIEQIAGEFSHWCYNKHEIATAPERLLKEFLTRLSGEQS
jgi:hypothetical protein